MTNTTLTEIQIAEKITTPMLEALENAFGNGKMILKQFQVTPLSVFDESWEDILTNILACSDLQKLVPELKFKSLLVDTKIESQCSFSIDGEFANLMYNGGAYNHFEGTTIEAKSITYQFFSQFFNSQYTDVAIFKTYKAWCPWFFDVAWDYTYIILDNRQKTFTIFCLTDTD